MQIELKTEDLRKSIWIGSLCGAIAWTVYAITEHSLGSLIPWLIKPGHVYVQSHWGFTGLLFLIYAIFGAVVTGAGGLVLNLASIRIRVLRGSSPLIFLTAFATLTIALVYLINFILNLPGRFTLSELPPVCAALILIFASGVCGISRTWFNRLKAFVNPLTASLLLLGLPWINQEIMGRSSFSQKAVAAVAYPCAVLSLAFCIGRLRSGARGSRKIGSAGLEAPKTMFVLFCIAAALFFINFFLKQEPLVVSERARLSTEGLKRPNVILIVMDTVRADHLSLYGYRRNTTPYLASFSEQASVFARALAPSDTTLSTHASMFTGLYPRRHFANMGLKTHPAGRPLDDSFRTLAEILYENGYQTSAIVANIAYLTPRSGLSQGFNYYDYRTPVPFLGHRWFGNFWFIRAGIRRVLGSVLPSSYSDLLYRRAEDINAEVYAHLSKPKIGKGQFFLFINYMDAHDPYMPPAPFDRMFPGAGESISLEQYWGIMWNALKQKSAVTNEQRSQLISQYDGGIAYVDCHLGRLMANLKQHELYDNSLIIVTSDHGEAFGERNLVGHGVSVYEDQVHVPMIVKWPNAREGRVVRDLVSLVDLFPTVLDVLGIEIPKDIDGKSLRAMEDEDARFVISESYPEEGLIRLHSRFDRIERSISWNSYKLVVSTAGKLELYDVSMDPNEIEDCFNKKEEFGKKLKVMMDQWIKSSEPKEEKTRSPSKLDRDTIERLRSLGYVK